MIDIAELFSAKQARALCNREVQEEDVAMLNEEDVRVLYTILDKIKVECSLGHSYITTTTLGVNSDVQKVLKALGYYLEPPRTGCIRLKIHW